jgi:glucose-6-phosphate isomerase
MELLKFNLNSPALLNRELDDGTLDEALAGLDRERPNVHSELLAHRDKWHLGWLDLPAGGDWVKDCTDTAAGLADECEELIVCGIGGSALGTQAVFAALDWPLQSLNALHVMDNVDPSSAAWLAEMADLPNAALNVISKSGGTLETMAGFLYMLGLFEMLNIEPAQQAKRIVATTDADKGPLRELAEARGWHTLAVPGDVGGRFSVLSPVGLLPLAFAGVDIDSLLAGGREMQDWLLTLPQRENPAWQLAATSYLLHTQGGVCESVLYTYGDPLTLLGDWFRQLWAESLAKQHQLDGSPGLGCLTPVTARGATDQHSQNQLFMEGPNDKLYGFVTCEEWAVDPQIMLPEGLSSKSQQYINHHSFGEILSACYAGTRDALVEAGRPVYEITFLRLNAASVGAYLQLWMLATSYAGLLYNVNAFDQPGVERSKAIAREYLGKM